LDFYIAVVALSLQFAFVAFIVFVQQQSTDRGAIAAHLKQRQYVKMQQQSHRIIFRLLVLLTVMPGPMALPLLQNCRFLFSCFFADGAFEFNARGTTGTTTTTTGAPTGKQDASDCPDCGEETDPRKIIITVTVTATATDHVVAIYLHCLRISEKDTKDAGSPAQ
jgi:hypothetical protein